MAPNVAAAAGAPLVTGTISSDANGNRVLDATGKPGSEDKPLAGVPVSLVRADNGQVLKTATTGADGRYEFGTDDLGGYAGQVRVATNLETYHGNIYATQAASTDNNLVRQAVNTATSADFTPDAAAVRTVNGLVKPVWTSSLALGTDAKGMGGQAVYTGTGPWDANDTDGQDTGPGNDRVRAGDLVNYEWNLSFKSTESLGAKAANAVFEQRLDLTEGAVANFDSIPGICQGTGAPTSQIVAQPSGKIVKPRTAPPAGTTSVTLTCNLGPIGQTTSALLPSTGVWTSPTSTNGGKVTTVARAYGVDATGAATIVPSNEVKQGPVTITSAPRYDIEKTPLTGPVFGTFDVGGQTRVPGQTVDYQITIAADRKVGLEAFTNPVTFTDTIYGQYNNNNSHGPNDSLIPGMKGYVVACDPSWNGGSDTSVMVYGKQNAAHPEQSVVDSGKCSYQRAASDTGEYTFTLEGIDASGSRYPTTYVSGKPIPADRFYVASYRVKVFIPYEEIDKAQGPADDNLGSLKVSNQVGGFDPKGASGASNFGDGFEPGYCPAEGPRMVDGKLVTGCEPMEDGKRSNNVAGPQPLQLSAPGWSKSQATGQAWGPGIIFRNGQNIWHDGTAKVQPGTTYSSSIGIENKSAQKLTNVGVCDVFDNTVVKLSTLDKNLANPEAAPSMAGIHAYVIESKTAASDAGGTAYQKAFQKNFQMRYAHVSLGDDNPNNGKLTTEGVYGGDWSNQAAVNCGDPSITWYDKAEDVPGGIDNVNAVRAVVDPAQNYVMPVGGSLNMWVAMEQRDTYNGGPHDGDKIPAGTVAADFARVTSDTWNKDWSSPRDYSPVPHSSSGDGDRWIVVRADMAITKETVEVDGIGTGAAPVGEVGKALAGNKVVWKVNPSLTANGEDPAPVENVVITDTLPKYATYDAMCTEGLTGGTPADQVVKNDDGTTTLTWNLGTITPNEKIAPRLVCTELDPLTPNNLGIVNKVNIKADGIIPVSKHNAQHTVTVQQAASLALKKAVDRDVDLQDDEQHYTLTVKNFAAQREFREPTILETLPFNGDATGPSGVSRAPESDYAGTSGLTGPVKAFDASGTKAVDGTVYYTTIDPTKIPQDLNQDTDASIWTTDVADWSKVTGFKFVGATTLGNAASGDAASLVLKFDTKQEGNAPGDWYANRYTAFSKDLLDDDKNYMMLTSNQTNVRILGFSLGDLIWTDMDNDGKFSADVDKAAPAGVEVQVFKDGQNDPVATVKTDADGRWHADNLAEGQYYVVIPASQFAEGAPLHGFYAQTVNSSDSGVDANEDKDHNAVQDGEGVRSKGLVTLSADQTPTTITGNAPLGDNVAGLKLPAGTSDDFTNLTIDLALVKPGYEFEKTSNPKSGTAVASGSSITYTLTGKNTGGTGLDKVVINDDLSKVLNAATMTGQPSATITGPDAQDAPAPALDGDKLSWSGSLGYGQTVTITYTVTLNDGVEGTVPFVENTATSTATPPVGPPITPPPGETTHPIPGYEFSKNSDPASGTSVRAGDEIVYTLTGKNTGGTALDPVVINDDLSKVLNAAKVTVEPTATISGPGADDAPKPALADNKLTWEGTLAAGQTVTITYTVKIDADVEGEVPFVKNTATSTATPPVGPPITPPPGVTEHPIPGYAFTKSSNPEPGTSVRVGSQIVYTLTGKNTGGTDLDPVVIDDDLSKVLNAATMVGEPSATINGENAPADAPKPSLDGTKLSWNGTLAKGQTVTVTYTVKINDGVEGEVPFVKNTATSTATPPVGPPITPPPGETDHPIPGYELTKVSDPESGTLVMPGKPITYTVTGKNTGATDLDPVVINDDLSQVLNHGTLTGEPVVAIEGQADVPKATVEGTKLSWTGSLKKGQSVTITYTVTLNKDAEGVLVNNHASSTATPPVGPPITPPDVVTEHPTPGYTFSKVADPVSGTDVQAGDVITYTLSGNNFGKTVLDPVEVTDDLSKVLEFADIESEPVAKIVKDGVESDPATGATREGNALNWTGTLQPGEQIVVKYSVKVKEGMEGKTLKNDASSEATPPGEPPIAPPGVVTEHPVPGYTFAKTADPASGSTVMPGQEITYTLKGVNTGATVLDPVEITDNLSKVLDNAKLTGEPKVAIEGGEAGDVPAAELDGTQLTWSGSLKVGQSVTITYTVKVNEGTDKGAVVIENAANSVAHPPVTPPITPQDVTTEHPVPGYTLEKTSDPKSGSSVRSGDVIAYTVTGSNTGATPLDTVEVKDDLTEVLKFADIEKEPVVKIVSESGEADPEQGAVLEGNALSWTGSLQKGERVVVTYSVKVKADIEGKLIKNKATSVATPPGEPETPITPPEVTTEHPVPGFELTKAADPGSGEQVKPGTKVTYTVTGINTGATVLDPVTITDDMSEVLNHAKMSGKPAAVIVDADGKETEAKAPTLDGTTLWWEGKLSQGERVILTYSVKVDKDAWGVKLRNVVSSNEGNPPPPVEHEVPPNPSTPPTEPTEPPTEPTTPPTEPTEPPTEPTMPPTEPSNPSMPPSEPGNPSMPPSEPGNPTEPGNPSTPPTLPNTGTAVTVGLLVVAGLALLGGAALMLIRRRGRHEG